MMDKDFKKEAQVIQPLLHIGKNGVTDAFVSELDHLLKKKSLVKIKLLRSFADSNETKPVADELSVRLKAQIVMRKGNVIVFYRHEKSD